MVFVKTDQFLISIEVLAFVAAAQSNSDQGPVDNIHYDCMRQRQWTHPGAMNAIKRRIFWVPSHPYLKQDVQQHDLPASNLAESIL